MNNRSGFFKTIAAPFSSLPLLASLRDIEAPVIAAKEVQPPMLCQLRGANQCGSRLQISPLAECLYPGDGFTVEGIHISAPGAGPGWAGGFLVRFTVTQTADSGSSVIQIYPPIIPSGHYQNVSGDVRDGAIIRRHRWGTSEKV